MITLRAFRDDCGGAGLLVMNPLVSDSSWLSAMPALVVEPEPADRTFLVSMLTAAGLAVIGADDFESARMSLVRRPPSVLITEIRLGYHNGLHLAHLGRWLRPEMIQVVTSNFCDPVLTRDAEDVGAIFVKKPVLPFQLLALLRDIVPSCVRRRDDEHRER